MVMFAGAPIVADATAISSTAAGGNWSAGATWIGGVVPGANDSVTISDGATVTINTTALAKGVTVGTGSRTPATLIWDAAAARTLTVGGSVFISSNGAFQTPTSGSVTTHLLTLSGDLINDGVLDFQTKVAAGIGSLGSDITFNGATSNTFGGAGSRTNIQRMTVNKGSQANVLELNPANFLVASTNYPGPQMSFLTLTSGTFKISGTFIMAGQVFSTVNYNISENAGFWLNNPSFTVTAQNATVTVYGLLRISQGTFNVGTAAGNGLNAGSNNVLSGGTFIIEGGTLNVAGGFIAVVNAYTYTQTGGTVNSATAGVTGTGFYFVPLSFSSFTLSGGAINLVQATTDPGGLDYSVSAITLSITGGTLTAGTGATTPGSVFKLFGTTPSLVIDNTTNSKEADGSPGSNDTPLTIDGNLIINAGSTLAFPSFMRCNVIGSTLLNNGTLNGANVLLRFGGSVPQTLTGTGLFTTPLLRLEVDNTNGLTLDPGINQITVSQIFLLNGGTTHSEKLTLGNGGSSTAVVQIGSSTSVSQPGVFDVAPAYNIGTGGEKLYYFNITSPRTIGVELSPSRILTLLVIQGGNSQVILTGGNLTVSSSTTLNSTRFVTGSNVLIIPTGATVSANLGFVDGFLRQTFTAAALKHFDVGTAVGYLGMDINATGPFPATVTVNATGNPLPVYPGISLKRYWFVNAPANFGAGLTFLYQGADIGPQDYSKFVAARYDGSFTTFTGTASSNTVFINSVNSIYGAWTLLEPDTDFDGIRDSYEDAHAMNKIDAADAAQDFDGDGMTNLAEYLAATDPRDAASRLRVVSITRSGTNCVISFSAEAGRPYRLEFKNSLADLNWQLVSDLTPNISGTAQITDNSAGTTPRFYRIRLLLP